MSPTLIVTRNVSGNEVFTSPTNPVPVVQTGTPALPTGAATAAKQPALGTAGTPSAEVLSVQGVASGTPVSTTGVGYSATASKTRPADTSAYSVGDVLAESTSAGTVWTFASIGPSAGRILITAITIEVDVSAVWTSMGAFRLHLYDAAPTAINDNAAFDLAAGDRTKYLGFIDVGTPEDLGSTLWAQDDTVRKQVKLAAASTSLYAMLETRAGSTPTSAAVVTVGMRSVRLE